MVTFNLLSGHKGLRRKTTRKSAVGVREFYSASEAWTALSYSTRERQSERGRWKSKGWWVRKRERARGWNSSAKRRWRASWWVLGGRERPRGGRRMEAVVGAFYGCAVRSRRRHDERAWGIVLLGRGPPEGPGDPYRVLGSRGSHVRQPQPLGNRRGKMERNFWTCVNSVDRFLAPIRILLYRGLLLDYFRLRYFFFFVVLNMKLFAGLNTDDDTFFRFVILKDSSWAKLWPFECKQAFQITLSSS